MFRLTCRAKVCVLAVGVLLAAATYAHATEQKRYEGFVVARVDVSSPAELESLLAVVADVWSEDVGVGPIDVMLAGDRLSALDELGLRYTVWIDDVQRLIDAERIPAGREWFNSYHPYDEIVAYLTDLAADYPTLAQMVNVGTSLEGRTIWGLRIAGPGQHLLAPGVIYYATVHAREWIVSTVPPYVATYLLSNYGTNPTVTDLVDNVEWFLVPVGNPDGYVYSWTTDRLWRKNRRDNGNGTFGVDINRNWSFGWGLSTGSSGTPSAQNYRGPEPFSEPETRALRDLFLTHPNVRAMNDLHSYSQLILWPWGYTSELPPDQPAYLVAGQTMRNLIFAVHGLNYTYGPIYSTIYPVSGGSVDWTYGVRGIFSFSFELRDTGTYGFLLPPEQIIPNNQEVLPALLYLANTPQVRATRITLPEGLPAKLVSGEPTHIAVTITSGVETLNISSAALHYRYDASGPFFTVPLAHQGGASFRATLPPTNCSSTPRYYFSITGSAGTTTSPPNAPATTYSASMVSGLVIYQENLDTNPGWSTQGLWAWGRPLGKGGLHGYPDPNRGYTGLNVYGYNLNGDYENNLPERHLTSLPINCTHQWGLRLSFWRWLGVERPPYDRASVRVSNNGVNWVTVWQNTAEVADNRWVYQDFDISAVADNQPTVYLRWTMGPTDSGWTYCGWNIDDIQIYATGCVGMPGDYDGDNDLDFVDAEALAGCLAGPGGGLGPGCGVFDFDLDADVDLADLARFQRDFGVR